MNKIFIILLSLITGTVSAAPFIIADVSLDTIQPTHCGIYIDTSPKTEIVVVKDAAGKAYCKVDVGTLTIGAHTIKKTYIVKDPIWGTLESAQSVPFAFSRPMLPTTPVGLELAP
jgi:hypothetical protein